MSYTASEKLAIVKYAEAHGNRAAGRQYDGVSESERLGSSCHPQRLSQVLHLKRTWRQRRRRGVAGSTERVWCGENDDGGVYYDGALNDVNLATIQSLLDSDDENTFEDFR